MNINKLLEKYGLTDRESDVLINLYGHTDATSFKISKETGIPKTTVYDILESLKTKGLVNSWKKNNIAYYYCESPLQLKKVLEEKMLLAEQIIPELQILSQDKERPSTKMYSGERGIKIVLDDVIETSKNQKLNTIEAIFTEDMGIFFPKYTARWVSEREKSGIRIKIIQPSTETSDNRWFENNSFRETRLMPGNFPIQGSMIFYGSKIAFFSVRDNQMYSVIIESNIFSNMIRQLFMFTWERLEVLR